jgi:hypothetical protein
VYRAVPAALAVDITVTAPVFGIYGFSWLPNLEGFQILIQVFLNTFKCGFRSALRGRGSRKVEMRKLENLRLRHFLRP